MSNDQQQETDSPPKNTGDIRGGVEYPTSHPKESAILERKAIKNGWISVIDEHAESMAKRIVVDVLHSDTSPRDRRQGFAVLMKAKNDEEAKLGGANVNITPEDVAAAAIAMENRIETPEEKEVREAQEANERNSQ